MIAYASMLGNGAHASAMPKRRYYKNVISETLYSSQSVIPVMTSGSVPSGSVASNISNMTCTLAAYVLWSRQNYIYHPYYNTGSKYNKYTFASPIAAGRYRLSFSFNNSGSSSVPDHKINFYYTDGSSNTIWTYGRYGSGSIACDVTALKPVTAIEYTYSCSYSGKDYGEEAVSGLMLLPPLVVTSEVTANDDYDFYVDGLQTFLPMGMV